MSRTTKAERASRQEAIDRLREWIKPGDTVYTVLESVSRSGMSRTIRCVLPYVDTESCRVRTKDGYDSDCELTFGRGCHADIARHRIDFLHPNHAIADVIGARQAKRGDGLIIGGCGMDMGFHLVNSLSEALYGYLRCEACGELPAWELQRLPLTDRPGCVHCGAAELAGGYACLGKGKCPSNYHVNHRDRVRCDGANGRPCYRPYDGGRYPVAEDWPRCVIDIGDGQTVDGGYYAAIERADGSGIDVCPTCGGEGDLANPEGPERWDLLHTDGYAIKQRWL